MQKFILLFLALFSLQLAPVLGQEAEPAAENKETYLPFLKGKKLGLIVNHTSRKGDMHLVDFLLSEGIDVIKIFAPEHGFRGDADAGEQVASGKDPKTGLEVVSLYGNNKKPSPSQLKGIDVLLFDIQDVGVRFYTYISTMHYAMEAAAENKLTFMVLDRPNPLGHIVDGPMLEPEHQSFVGMHPIPVIHGLTVAELAQMIAGEGWLAGGIQPNLQVIPMQHYQRTSSYTLPIKPSPNLPNQHSILWYPSLCFFEGTAISVGRGTYDPFQIIGYPDKKYGSFSFTPVSIDGMSKYPPHQDKVCYGVDLRDVKAPDYLDLNYLINFYQKSGEGEKFFNAFFTNLAGTKKLKEQIIQGQSAEEIRASWKNGLDAYKVMRKSYLLYP
jgi:uncharacterized protein YbbC (DUF1343 family)